MSHVITRTQMVDWMESIASAKITEQPSRNWRRLNTVIADQGAGSIDCEALRGFHLFEVVQGGKLVADIRSDLEGSDHLKASLQAGMLQYAQNDTDCVYTMEGRYRVQQIYIDHSIFQDVASAMVPGDPAQVRTLGFHGIFDPVMKQTASAILDEARNPSAGGELYADMLAQQIALLILRRQHNLKTRTPSDHKLSDAELARIIEHLQADLAETGGVDTLAGLVGMEPISFSRAFKTRTGQAPHQYLIDMRLAKIKELLVHTDDGLADIAYATGFSSQSHMTTTFSNHAGAAPGRYRAEARRRR